MSIILPVRDEEGLLAACLESLAAQDYPKIVEVVVADGGSTDRTAELAASYPKVVVVDNPRRSRPAGLNVALRHATGEIVVRVDARTRLAADYVSRCVEALERSGAAIVGGPMAYEATTPGQRAFAAAMSSRLGAGPAEFRRPGGEPRFVDTVYLGAFRKEVIDELGGYDEWSGGNEDAELAYRAQIAGGVFLDPAIWRDRFRTPRSASSDASSTNTGATGRVPSGSTPHRSRGARWPRRRFCSPWSLPGAAMSALPTSPPSVHG